MALTSLHPFPVAFCLSRLMASRGFSLLPYACREDVNPWTQSSEVIAHCVRETETEIERLHELYFRIRKEKELVGGFWEVGFSWERLSLISHWLKYDHCLCILSFWSFFPLFIYILTHAMWGWGFPFLTSPWPSGRQPVHMEEDYFFFVFFFPLRVGHIFQQNPYWSCDLAQPGMISLQTFQSLPSFLYPALLFSNLMTSL